MLDMGFEPEMKKIFAALPERNGARQTLLFSATWPKSIRKLAAKFMRDDAQQVFIGDLSKDGDLGSTRRSVKHSFRRQTTKRRGGFLIF